MRKISLNDILDKIENYNEKILFVSRWLLSPMYFLLIFVLILILIRFVFEVADFVSVMQTLTYNEWIMRVLELLDLTLVANLVLIVAFSGYENFISKIGVAEEHVDRPSWMGHLDFSGLKLKIIGSVVAISLIELLQDFLNAPSIDPTTEFWRVILHLTFVVTGFAFACMEILSTKRHALKQETFSESENE
ncbi:YqhA family protein [Methanobrevibacter sp.]|uniref:YqhA family protein n=1 Tax=Methanobrevibacter sp. TaxID=66852 RepID=UPI003869B4A8